jgi:hypothetical protein
MNAASVLYLGCGPAARPAVGASATLSQLGRFPNGGDDRECR